MTLENPTHSTMEHATIHPFPTTREQFETDPRVSWSRVSGKWTLESEEGSEYEYDEALNRWVLMLDESLAEQQRAAYAVLGVDEAEPAQLAKKKRKAHSLNEFDDSHLTKKARSASTEKQGVAVPGRTNKAVYVTNLPQDTTEDELKELFSKCGVIAEEIDAGKPRIKIYADAAGVPKGDALIVYFRPESVPLAIQMLDDTDFRFKTTGTEGKMRVQAADFSYKSQQDVPVKKSSKEKRKVIAKMQKLNNKLADWDDDDMTVTTDANSRWDKTVILKHMFTLQELEDDPAALLDLKQEIREECEKLGEVTNVVLYDQEPDGVVSVRFKIADSARACIRLMEGRFFGGQKVEAYLFDGTQKFKKATSKQIVEDNKDEAQRLEKYGSWLEAAEA